MNEKINLNGILNLLSEKLITWYELIIKSIPNIIAAVIVFMLFLGLAKLIRSMTDRILPKLTKNIAVTSLLRTIIYFLVIIIGSFVSLEILNLDKTVTSILAGAGVIGLALGFAFQEIASNFVSGIFIAFREPYKLDDIIEIDNYFGTISKITLRTTSITTFQGLEVIIPNKYMFTKPFINLTTTPTRRIDITIGVSYGEDLRLVESVTRKALENIEERIKTEDIEVYYNEFDSSSINFQVRIWINYPANNAYLKAKHEAIIRIKEAFDENDIIIPFPIRTLDFGIKGGMSLGEALPSVNNSTQTLNKHKD